MTWSVVRISPPLLHLFRDQTCINGVAAIVVNVGFHSNRFEYDMTCTVCVDGTCTVCADGTCTVCADGTPVNLISLLLGSPAGGRCLCVHYMFIWYVCMTSITCLNIRSQMVEGN